jgi:hypothetical protein
MAPSGLTVPIQARYDEGGMDARIQSGLDSDPWRRRMRRLADRLRVLDERLFEQQISSIEACIHRDANWNLEAALSCGERCRLDR